MSLTSPITTQPKVINLPRATGSFTHDVYYAYGSGTMNLIAAGAGTSTTWTPPASLATFTPKATSGVGTLRVITKSGATTIGSKDTAFTLWLDDAIVPTVTQTLWDDQNTTVKTDIGAFVQGQSNLKANVTGEGIYGSTIVTGQTRIGATVTPQGELIPVNLAGTIAATGEVVDSRGRTGSKDASFSVLPYNIPTVTSWVVRRSDALGVAIDDGEYLSLDLTAAITSLMVGGVEKNAMTITVRTRPVGGAWTLRNTYTSGVTYSKKTVIAGGAVYLKTSSYEVEVLVVDKISVNDSVPLITVISTSLVTMDLNGTKVGIGKYHEQGALDVGGDVYANGEKLITERQSQPAGSIMQWPASTAPNGWVMCDGQAVSRTEYADLFAIIGSNYGPGNGTTTFNVPDFRGRVAAGVDGTPNFLEPGTQGGRVETHHAFYLPPRNSGNFQDAGTNYGTSVTDDINGYLLGNGSSATTRANVVRSVGGTIGTNGTAPTEVNYARYTAPNLQPYTAVNFIIKGSGGVGELKSTVESVVLGRLADAEEKLERQNLMAHFQLNTPVNLNTGWTMFLTGSYWTKYGSDQIAPWNNGFVAPRTGLYIVEGGLWSSGAVPLHLVVKKNATDSSMGNAVLGNMTNTTTSTSQVTTSGSVYLEAGDILTMGVYTATAGTRTANISGTFFSAKFAAEA